MYSVCVCVGMGVGESKLSVDGKMCLGYWAIRGLAQPIRLLLEYTGTEYVEKRFEQEEGPGFSKAAWYDVKDTLLGEYPFPNLPFLADGDVLVTQSNAILRYLGRKNGLLGTTEEEMVKVDILLEEAMDFRNRTVSLAYSPQFQNEKEAYATLLATCLTKYTKFLGESSWFAGESLTIVDFHMYELLDQNEMMFPESLKEFPSLKAFLTRFEELPPIKSYMASEHFLKFPSNNQHSFTTINKIC